MKMTSNGMTMSRLSTRCALAALLLVIPFVHAAAQAPAPKDDARFNFGPPLRSENVFVYKYTERVTERHEMDGQMVDSSQRLLTYYISQRQVQSRGGTGLLLIEANIDSMEIDVRKMDGSKTYFHTQRLTGAQEELELIRNREVFGPSTLVNRMVTFTLSPYGEVVKVESPSLKQARQDVNDPGIDDFTRARILEVMTDEYLTAVYFPWRNVAPLFRKVPYDKDIPVPFLTAFNRISYRDTATVRVVNGPDGAPHLTYFATLDRPLTKSVTIAAFDEPVKIDNARVSLSGDLKLDDDGVVLSGWTTMNGTTNGKRQGVPIKSTIAHEVYVQQIAVTPFTSSN